MVPEVSVVIVNFNAGRHLSRCLRQLAEQTFANFEALVLDNASSDGSFDQAAAALADPRFQFIALGANPGFAAANNRGAKLARGRWLACLNPDAFPHADWLEALLAAAGRHPEAGMFASLQLDAKDPSLLDGAGDCYHAFGLAWRGGYGQPSACPLPEAPVFSACAAAALYDRARFLALGGFDERFFCFFEDVDLGFRWRLSGGSCVLVPAAVVEHLGSASSSQISGFAHYHGTRNAVWCFVKNMPGPLVWLCLPGHVALMTLMLVSAWRHGQGRFIARALIDAVGGLAETWRQRRAVQTRRAIGWAQVARVLAWSPAWLATRRPRLLAR